MLINNNAALECLHLDPAYHALTVQNLMTVSECFNLLDIHNDQLLNDLQVKIWMKHNTDLKQPEVIEIFQLIDIYASGFFDLEMFYFFTTIMICSKDHLEKDFINRHSRSIYNLFETRMKGKMTVDQFEMVGWLFGFEKSTVKFFFKEFDISKTKKILLEEFKLYAVICIELQCMLDGYERISAFHDYRRRLIWSMKDKLVNYVKYYTEPRPAKLIKTLKYIQQPYIKHGRGVRRLNPYQRFKKSIKKRWKIMKHNSMPDHHEEEAKRLKKKIRAQSKNHKDDDNRKCSLKCCRKNRVENIQNYYDKNKTVKKRNKKDDNFSLPEWIKNLDEKARMRHHQPTTRPSPKQKALLHTEKEPIMSFPETENNVNVEKPVHE